MVLIRNKNALLELIKGGANIREVSIVQNLDKDDQTSEIVYEAEKREILVKTYPINNMPLSRSQKSRDVIVGHAEPLNGFTLGSLIDDLYQKDILPFFLLLNRVNFPENIGTIARTAFAAGVNGLIFQGSQKDFITEESVHYSLGAILRIPIIKLSIFEAIKSLSKDGIPVYSLNMNGKIYFQKDLRGAVAFVLGGERGGVSSTVEKNCSDVLSIPMESGIGSLNVATSAAILMYEKIRQEKFSSR